MKTIITVLLVVLGVVFLALAILYFVTPAQSLPHWLPGYVADSTKIHIKHGLASMILAVGCGILAWFSLGKKQTT